MSFLWRCVALSAAVVWSGCIEINVGGESDGKNSDAGAADAAEGADGGGGVDTAPEGDSGADGSSGSDGAGGGGSSGSGGAGGGGSSGSDGAGSDGSSGSDGASGGGGGASSDADESCTLPRLFVCIEFKDQPGVEEWCRSFGDTYAVSTEYARDACEAGAVIACDDATGAELGPLVGTILYYPGFVGDAREACEIGGGVYREL